MSREANLRMWLVAVFLLVIAAAANAKTIYVDADRPDGGGGTNWTDAYKYLQDALADANTSAKPVEIRVAQGTYRPDEGAGVTDGDRTATFQLINGVTLKGGYAGFGEPDPNAQDVNDYETILSGDLDGNDVPVATIDLLNEPTRAENSLHVAYANDVNATAVLDGFTITAGNANGAAYPDNSAAGLRSSDSTITLQNCTFVANSGSGYYGAMSRWDDLDRITEISNCSFISNYANGSGDALGGELMILTDCQFNNNYGFGLYLYNGCSVTDCVFSGNTGAGMFAYKGAPVLTNCAFVGNSDRGLAFSASSNNPEVTNCIFINNSTATEGGGMCAAFIAPVAPTLVNCTFAGNHAGTNGGGVSYYVVAGQIPSATNCVFTGNTAGNDGGGFYSSHDYTKFTNCTFANNQADGDGGGYCLDDNLGTPDFNNCIFWGNTAYGEGPQIALKTPYPTVVTVNYSDVEGDKWDVYIQYPSSTTLVWDDVNNINSDPCFVDADGTDDTAGTEDDNLRLLADSDCIDAGDNTAVQADTTDLDGDANTAEPVPYDLDGNPRFIDDLCTADTGNGIAPVVDMGAYEFLRSDINSNGDVNFRDFAQFALHWLDVACGACGGADLICDGDVDWNDVRELADNWLW